MTMWQTCKQTMNLPTPDSKHKESKMYCFKLLLVVV